MSGQTVRAMGVQSLGALFCALVSFVLLAWLGRVLGVQGFGHYVFVLNLAVFSLMLIEGGWPTLVYRETASSEGVGALAAGGAQLHALLVTTVVVCMALGAGRLGWGGGPSLAAAVVCMGWVGLMNLVSARMRGEGRFVLEAAWQSLGRVVSALCMFATVTLLPEPAIGPIFLAWAAGLVLVVVVWGRGWVVAPSLLAWRRNVSRALPLMLLAGATAFLFKADVILLGYLAGDGVLSAYAAATRFVEAALLLFAPLCNVLLRRCRRLAGEPVSLDVAVRGWVSLSLALGLMGVMVSFFFGHHIVKLVFGGGFDAAADLLPWVMLMLPFGFANLVLTQVLLALDHDRSLLRMFVFAGGLLMLLGVVGWWLAVGVGVALAVAFTQACLFGGLFLRVLSFRA